MFGIKLCKDKRHRAYNYKKWNELYANDDKECKTIGRVLYIGRSTDKEGNILGERGSKPGDKVSVYFVSGGKSYRGLINHEKYITLAFRLNVGQTYVFHNRTPNLKRQHYTLMHLSDITSY